MAIRTTVRDVRELVPNGAEDNVILNNYIVTANAIVDTYLLTAGLSAAILIEIEKYLAAHFTAIFEEKGGLVKVEIDDATDEYADIYSAGYNSTRFGQQAIVLDSSGTLANLGTGKLKALFRVV